MTRGIVWWFALIFTVAFWGGLVGYALAQDGPYRAEIVSIYDGDTVRADVHLGLDVVLLDQPLRLVGFDTPEIRGSCEREILRAEKARNRLLQLLGSGAVTVHLDGKGKYGRWLATVYVDGADVAEVMIGEGHAREYQGEARKGWC